MSIIAVIGAFLQLVFLIFKTTIESDQELKAKQEKAINEVKEGLKNKDATAITAAFDSVNRLR